MNKRIKEMWIAALTSGKYKQGKGYLRLMDADSKESFCCLGVLCDLAEKEGVVTADQPEGGNSSCGYPDCDVCTGRHHYLYDGRSGSLPSAVQKWAGMKNENGFLLKAIGYDIYREARSLIDLNDDAKYDFNQIAEVINEQF